MAITENTVIDQITVTENGSIFYREATVVSRDGNEIARTYHRTSLEPGQDLSGVPESVVAICNIVWTQEVIDAFKANQPVPPGSASND